jgi:hypothetical protein
MQVAKFLQYDLRFRVVRKSIYSDKSDEMKKVKFREQRFMKAISKRFRRMNEDNIQRNNNRRIESTSSLFTRTRCMSHEAWKKDDCKITSWRITKRDENALNRRRDTEMYVNWKFHLLSHWTSSWDEFDRKSKDYLWQAKRRQSISSRFSKFFQISQNSFRRQSSFISFRSIHSFSQNQLEKQSDEQSDERSNEQLLRQSTFSSSSSKNQSTDRQSFLIIENLKHLDESSNEQSVDQSVSDQKVLSIK